MKYTTQTPHKRYFHSVQPYLILLLALLLPLAPQAQDGKEYRTQTRAQLDAEWMKTLGPKHMEILQVPVTVEATGPQEGVYAFLPLKLLSVSAQSGRQELRVGDDNVFPFTTEPADEKANIPGHFAPVNGQEFDRFVQEAFPDLLVVVVEGGQLKDPGYAEKKLKNSNYNLALILKQLGLQNEVGTDFEVYQNLPDLRNALFSSLVSWARANQEDNVLALRKNGFAR
ncbi:MAG: hypothetical protein AAF570_18130, partial [Bacteroidota bacterium]